MMTKPVAESIAPPSDPEVLGLRPSSLKHPVVGLGASAGGMQALISFFEQMPADSGMSFVVVIHLSPKHESHAAAILQRATAMPVLQVTESMPIEVDHVYVIPPGKTLGMDDGRLHLSDTPHLHGRNVAIDTFFRMLAQVHAAKSISIVLSGTGADGAVGVTRIKEHGGVVMAQAPADAEQDGMPNAAIATGVVDFILPVAEMPAKLLQLVANARSIRLPADVLPIGNATAPATAAEAQAAEAALVSILSLLRARTHRDFRHYKRPTVLRRLERRMQVTAVPTLPAYLDYLQSHGDEAPALLQDMLISVTNFFRDHASFDALERNVLPDLYAELTADQEMRVWVVGCASGEEAYSLAMLLQECRERTPDAPNFQIFASDIGERALLQARAALYPSSISTDVTASRLRTFFHREQEQYRVVKTLRERVLFANHNVLRDPPFSRVDIISCRNLLIYLDRSAQAAVLELFRFALKPGGVLFLGSSESPDVADDAFTVIDKRHRMYRVNRNVGTTRLASLVLDMKGSASSMRLPAVPSRTPTFAEMHARALQAHAPASVLVDAQYKILHMSGGVARFVQAQTGVPSHNLLDNLNPALRLDLRAALFRLQPAAPSEQPRPPFSVETDDGKGRVKITVQTLRDAQEEQDLLLVLFTELEPRHAWRDPANPGAANDPSDPRDPSIAHLEAGTKHLQMRLHEVMEHSEASNEELMSSNEELQAVNEELRSATEELETSREELQSTNEELITVNSQLALRVEETSRSNDDLQNLINSHDIATVFVDREMRIKRYTPRATDLFNLIPTDVGRSLLDITHKLAYPEMVDDAKAAFLTLRLAEREVSTDGHDYVARVLPYRTAEDKIEGAILSFVEVTVLRQYQHEASSAQQKLGAAVESTRDYAVITADQDGNINGWNLGAHRLFGYEEDEIMGRPMAQIFTDEDRLAGVPAHELEQARQNGRAEDERWHRRKDGSTFYCSGVTTRLNDNRGFAKIARDLTGSQQSAAARDVLLSAERAGRRQAEATVEAKEIFLAVMSHELKHPLNLIHVNAELLARMPEVSKLPAAARAASIIQRTVAGQAKIVDDLLDLSRARTGKLTLDRAVVDWGDTVRRIVDALHADAQQKDVALRFELNAMPLLSLFDPVRAEQVVWNLLSNALKFTPKGGSVRAVLSAEDDAARLTVTDTGRGIDGEFLHRVFDMFSQEHGARGREEEGMGIGLALVRELVQAHGGRVQARSAGLGRGAEFSVWVPLHRAEALPIAGSQAPSVLQDMRVLVLDDSADSAQSFGLLLGLTGADVTAVTTGDEALASLGAAHFDLIVSDISMPGMSGLEFIAAVRARGGPRTLALACSGYGRAQDERSAIEAGFDALISKPAALAHVERVVAALMAARAAAAG